MSAGPEFPAPRDRLAVLGRSAAGRGADAGGPARFLVADPPEGRGGWVPEATNGRLAAHERDGAQGVPAAHGPRGDRGRHSHRSGSAGLRKSAAPRLVDAAGEPAVDGDRRVATTPPALEDAGDPVPAGAARLGARLVRHGPWGALAERWVPEPIRAARVAPGRRGAVIICSVALLAALVAGFLVWRDRPEPHAVSAIAPQPVSLATTTGSVAGRSTGRTSGPTASRASAEHPLPVTGDSTSSGVPASASSAPAPATGGPLDTATSVAVPSVIIVSVTGLVKHPGLVRLSPVARVADAIKAAGGVVGAGDLTGMNLAAKLTDGASVVVGPGGSGSVTAPAVAPTIEATAGDASPASGAAGDGTGGSGAAAAPIDLNTADAAALDALPGVGPVTAAAIVAYREQHGPFTTVDQLQAVSGIGPARFAQIAPHVAVGGAPP